MLKRLSDDDAEPPFTEPLIAADTILDGIEARGGRHIVKLVGMVTTPGMGRGMPAERRIAARLSIPLDVARTLWADADALREEGGYGDRRPEVEAAQFRDRRADN